MKHLLITGFDPFGGIPNYADDMCHRDSCK